MHLGVVGVAHPDRGEALRHPADREHVLQVIGGAGLERGGPPDVGPWSEDEGALRVGVVLEDVVQDPGLARIDDLLPVGLGVVAHDLPVRVDDLVDHRRLDAHAQVRDDLIGARHVDETHLARADAE